MVYVQGFVIPVPTKNRKAYRDLAAKAWAVFKKHGALRQVECWGDDVPEGKVTSFTMALQRRDDETAVFSWIEWPSKSACENGAKAAMDELSNLPGMGPDKIPFDGMRMFWGGFQPIFDESA
jgi:uncharacterized protein YbaA (DUF1428 family)